jgi:hypothetical protein
VGAGGRGFGVLGVGVECGVLSVCVECGVLGVGVECGVEVGEKWRVLRAV